MKQGNFYFILAFLIFLANPVWAAEKFVCESPKGTSVEWGDRYDLIGSKIHDSADGPRWDKDGFSNINPLIIINENTLLIDWDNTLPDDLVDIVDNQKSALTIPIAGRTEDSVWGFRSEKSTAEIYRFYYGYNLLYLVQSSVGLVAPEQPAPKPSQAAIFIAKCTAFK